MENTEEMKAKKKAAQRLTTGIIIGMTVIVLGYVAYALVTKNINMQIFEVLLGIFVIGYLVLSDVVEPWLTGLLKDMTQMRKTAYLKYWGWTLLARELCCTGLWGWVLRQEITS